MRIAVLGGSFDPVHNGHVALAKAAFDQLNVDQVRFMPAKQPPHKEGYSATESERLAMLELAIDTLSRQLDESQKIVIDRSELDVDQTSYSVLSMRALRDQIGMAHSVCFLMGWDSLQSFDQWWHWRDMFELVNIAVVPRPGFADIQSEPLLKELKHRLVDVNEICNSPYGKVAHMAFKNMNIASRSIRAAFTQSEYEHQMSDGVTLLSGELPESVAKYIQTRNVYRNI